MASTIFGIQKVKRSIITFAFKALEKLRDYYGTGSSVGL